MPSADSDPRVFFAAERTLLAWLRSGLAIMGLGFVVSRFGLFLHLLGARSAEPTAATHVSLSAGLGIAFVIIGSLAVVLAALQHWRFIATLPPLNRPRGYSAAFAVALSLLVGLLGLALAGYLWVTQP